MDQVIVSTPTGLYMVDADSGNISCHMRDSGSNLVVPVGTVGQGGVTGSRVICCPQSSKALLHFWRLNAVTGAPESSGNPVYKCSAPEKFTAMTFSSCGGLMFCGAASGTVYVWQTWTGNLLKSWTAHFGSVTCLSVSDDDAFLITASEDTIIKSYFLPDLFDSPSPVPVPAASFSGHASGVNHIIVADNYIVSASKDKSVKVIEWSLSSMTQMLHFLLPSEPTKVAINNTKSDIFVGSNDGSISVCSFDGEMELFRAAHKTPVTGLAITLDCSRIVTSAQEGVMIWDVASRMLVQSVIGPNQQLKDASALLMIRKPPVVPDSVAEAQPSGWNEKKFISSIDMYLQFKPLQRTLTPVETIDVVPLIRAAVPGDSATGPRVKNGILFNEESASSSINYTSRDDAVEKLQQELNKQRELTRSWTTACAGLYRRLLAITGEDVEIAIPLPSTAATAAEPSKKRHRK